MRVDEPKVISWILKNETVFHKSHKDVSPFSKAEEISILVRQAELSCPRVVLYNTRGHFASCFAYNYDASKNICNT